MTADPDARDHAQGSQPANAPAPAGSPAPAATPADALDFIPLADAFELAGPNDAGQCTGTFYAFNTCITLQAFAQADACREAFLACRDACRHFERLFSRTLPHSDIARLNAAHGAWTPIAPETFDLLKSSLRYCAESEGVFDITMGAAVRLWDFHAGIVPSDEQLAEALSHVGWRGVKLGQAENANVAGGVQHFARLDDPLASVDVGGTAKGWIADALGGLLVARGIENFLVNLGGNVLAHGAKPDGRPWRIGLQDPRHKREENAPVVGAVPLTNASAVTSGTYERSFMRDGVLYHHILDPATGMPARTDLAGACVVAETSMDAEGYSTTMLALGREGATEFMRRHARIVAAYLIDPDATVHALTRKG